MSQTMPMVGATGDWPMATLMAIIGRPSRAPSTSPLPRPEKLHVLRTAK